MSEITHLVGRINADTVIAAMAMLVALITGIFTAYQAYLTRRHNRLSVRPHVSTWVHEEKTPDYYIIRCEVLNNGIGPAILRDYSVFYQGTKIGSNQERKALEAAIKEKLNSLQGIVKKNVSVFGKEFSLLAGSRHVLFEMKIAMHAQFDEKIYQDFVDRFDADFSYRCMYGQKFKFSTKDHKK